MTIHELAEAQRAADGICLGCNGNERFTIGDKVIWCTVCHPEKARQVGNENRTRGTA